MHSITRFGQLAIRFTAVRTFESGPTAAISAHRTLSRVSGVELLSRYTNHEASGVPDNAGVDGPDGFDLGHMRPLLSALGSPQQKLPVAHVAGTKGKGSVVAMLSAILQQAGYKVGAYTSPHLLSLRERISVNSQPISAPNFDSLVGSSIASVRESQPQALARASHFELMTAVALRWFHQQQVDIALVEAGLGGARDATNIFPAEQLKAAVVTPIGLEHQGALGGTLESIAAAKAGIFKRGRPVVLGRQPHPEAKEVLCRCAAALDCPRFEGQAYVWPRSFSLDNSGVSEQCGLFLLNGECSDELDVRLGLIGEHQHDNAVTAASAALVLRQQGFARVSIPAIVQGLAKAHLPGRFQVGRLKSSRAGVSGGCWLVLDAAHTAGSAAALAATLRRAFPKERHRLGLVLAMAADKDVAGVAAALRGCQPDVVAFTTVPIAGSTSRAAPPGTLTAHWQAAGMAEARPTRMRELIQASLTAAVERVETELGDSPSGVICITGSMYAVAEALQNDLMV